MSFLAPIAGVIAAAIAVPALIALYFLKLRRREVTVPSTLLWRKSIEDLQVNAPFQRLRRSLLLLLQLLILASLLVAMARPAMQAAADPGQRVAIVVDHSASMNATDVAPSRLDSAKRTALELIDDIAADGGEAMVLSFAEQARTRQQFTTDPGSLRRAVEAIGPTDQRGRLAPALRLLEPHAQRAAEDDTSSLRIYVITDGRIHRDPDQDLTLPGARVEYVRVGAEDPGQIDNLGFVAFSARRDFERPERVQVFAQLANAGSEPVETNVELRIDGESIDRDRLTVPAARARGGEDAAVQPGRRSVQFRIDDLPESALLSVRHGHADMLAADNAAHLVLAPARRLRVLVVTEGNAFLERAIASVGVRGLERMRPEQFEAALEQDPTRFRRAGWRDDDADAGFDVIVFDRYAPEETVVNVDSLYFGAVPAIEGFSLRAAREGSPQTQSLLDWRRDHALLRHVALDDVLLREPGRLAVPMDGQVLATAQVGPVLATARASGALHIVAAFDVLQTNWPMQISFPVFLSNVVETLGLGALADEAGVWHRPGEVAAIPSRSEGRTLRYVGPTELHGTVTRGEAILPPFERAGLYQSRDDADPPFDRLAVNLLDATQTDIRPVELLRVGTIEAQGQAGSTRVRREVWPWFAWGALAVLMLEWLVYTRRMHL